MPRLIGVAICTVGIRDIDPAVTELLGKDTLLTLHFDQYRQGVARTRNLALKRLMSLGCTDMILLDDDMVPSRAGWEQYVVDTARANGVGAMGYPDPKRASLAVSGPEMQWWQYCTGCMTYVSRDAVEKIGYFGRYAQYGHEDIAYLARARMAGLTGFAWADASPADIALWLRSLDIYPTEGFDPEANLSNAEKSAAIDKGRTTFDDEIRGELYVPYWD